MTKDYEQMARDFIAAAREYRSWDEPRMERELRRRAAEQGYELELSEPQPGVYRAAFIKPYDQELEAGPFTRQASETTESLHMAMENLLLTAQFPD